MASAQIGYMTGGKSALWVDENIVDSLTKKATTFIDQHKAEPFFLYFATPEIHVPRMPNRRFVGKTEMGPRGDSIAELDWSVRQVLAALKRNGLAENTLVMFSSDNGPVVDDGYRDQAVEKLGGHKAGGHLSWGQIQQLRRRHTSAIHGPMARTRESPIPLPTPCLASGYVCVACRTCRSKA